MNAARLCMLAVFVAAGCGDDGGPTGTSAGGSSCARVSGPWVSSPVWFTEEPWSRVELFTALEQTGCQLTGALGASSVGTATSDSVFLMITFAEGSPRQYMECRLEIAANIRLEGLAMFDGDAANAFPIVWKGPSSDCEGTVSIDVDVGADAVTFDWAPDCGVNVFLVEPAESGGDMWAVTVDPGNNIVPAVVYGVVPDGAVEDSPAASLVRGEAYKVILWKNTVDGFRMVGYEQFVR